MQHGTMTTTLLGGPLDGQVMTLKWEDRGGGGVSEIHIPCLDGKPELDQGRYVWQPSVSAPPAHPCK